MNNVEMQHIADTLNLKIYGTQCVGLVGRWPVAFTDIRYNRFMVMTDQPKSSEIFKQIKSEIKSLKGSVSWNKKILLINYPSIKKLGTDIDAFVISCLRILDLAGINPDDHCPYCKQSNCDVAAFHKIGFGLAHNACLGTAFMKAQEKADANENQGNILTGLLGAILGMIIGTLPSLLTIVMLEYIYAILFALIPICAYYGYKLFNGKMNKSALIISIIMAILGVFVLNLEFTIYQLMVEIPLTFSESIQVLPYLLTDMEYLTDITVGSLDEFFFSILGVWFAWRYISGTAQGTANTARAIQESAIPYRPFHQASLTSDDFNSYTEY